MLPLWSRGDGTLDFRRLVRARLMYREAAEPPYAISSMRMNRTYRGVHVRVVMRGDACHFGSERSSFACLLRCLRALHRIQPCWWHEGASSTVERPVTICLATGAMLVMSHQQQQQCHQSPFDALRIEPPPRVSHPSRRHPHARIASTGIQYCPRTSIQIGSCPKEASGPRREAEAVPIPYKVCGSLELVASAHPRRSSGSTDVVSPGCIIA